MTSIHTNTAAMAALNTLRSIDNSIGKTQAQTSSGLRVSDASDNAAYWSIATTMKSEHGTLSAVSDAIGFTSAVLDTAYNGMEAIRDQFSTIRNLFLAASQMPPPKIDFPYSNVDQVDPGFEQSQQAKIAHEIDQRMLQIRSILSSSSFGGVNLLYVGDNSPINAHEVVNSFVTGYAEGKVLTKELPLKDTLLVNDSYMDDATFSYDPDDGGLLDPSYTLYSNGNASGQASFTWWVISSSGGTTSPIQRSNNMVHNVEMYIQRFGGDRQTLWKSIIQQVDERLQIITDSMTKLGALQKSVQGSDAQVKSQIDTIGKGIGRLVDADMDDTSTRVKALETQKQLGIQSLQIANNNASNIMHLFE
jgi:flagellin